MKKLSFRRLLLLVLLIIVVLVRFVPHWGETYARDFYPYWSAAVSFIAAIVPFSIDEWIVIGAVLSLIVYSVITIRRRQTSITHLLSSIVEIMLWIVAWFYVGWGMNYFRDSFFQREGVECVKVDKMEFCRFIKEYTDSLNSTYKHAGKYANSYGLQPVHLQDSECDSIHADIKRIYKSIADNHALCKPQSWQNPKAVAFNWLYSSVGVLGYMGPFADESHLNRDIFPVQYPYTYAHELAHMLSVSSEAEANFWAYEVCIHSEDAAIRYTGYFGLMPNVFRNAREILSEREFDAWRKTINPKIIEQRVSVQNFWREQYSPLLSEIQDAMFNALLKGNKIPEGMANYDQVVQMIMSSRKNRI